MATYSKLAIQPTTMTTGTGLGTLVVATATLGTTIHTGANVATTVDEVWLYANNTHSSAVTLTIEFGGVAAKDKIQTSLALSPGGLILICAGLVLQGNTTPKVITAFAGTASVVSIFGYINRITA